MYTAQLLAEGFSPFSRSATFETFLVDDIARLGGSAVSIDETLVSRANRQSNRVDWTAGDRLKLTGHADNHEGTSVAARTLWVRS